MKDEFKEYRRTRVTELRPVTQDDVKQFMQTGFLLAFKDEHFGVMTRVSISEADIMNGSPQIGDMIARNPDNHADQWLVAKDYFEKNFEEI